MKRLSSAVLLVLIGAVPRPTCAGVIHGTVTVPPRTVPAVAASMNAYPGRVGSMAAMQVIERGRVGDAVLFVDRVPARAESALAASRGEMPRLAQKDQCFVPRVVAIAAGMKVDFPNLDPIYHNVFSFSPARRFDLGKYPRGNSRQVVFPKPGLVNVYCDIHTSMEAFVLVLPHHGIARPSVTGDFALPDLPAGHYVLHAWHPDLGEQKVGVDIPASGDVTADVRF